MYTAKFNRTEETAQGTRFFVDFTNGTETFTEACIPQDKDGFDYWVKGRLDAFNTAEQLKQQFTEGVELKVPEAPKEPELTEDEKSFHERRIRWFNAKEKLKLFLELKEMAEKTGKTVAPERQAEIDALAAFVDENIELEFFN